MRNQYVPGTLLIALCTLLAAGCTDPDAGDKAAKSMKNTINNPGIQIEQSMQDSQRKVEESMQQRSDY